MIENFKKFLNEDQDPKAVEKIAEKLSGLLMKEEIIEFIAVQKKPGINLSPDGVALTNKRIIFCRPKTLGLSMEFQDYIWKDILDCHLKEEIFGAIFMVKTLKGTSKIDYLQKLQARKLYTVAQEQEEIQKEYRRQRDLEDKRAGAGNVVVTASVPTAMPPTHQAQGEDPLASLQKLKTLLDNGLITEVEFNSKKVEILSRL